MKCRVYHRLDGTVAVIHPNPRLQHPGEDDDAFLDRLITPVVLTDSQLEGLPYVNVEPKDLPPRAERKDWRITKGALESPSRRAPDPPPDVPVPGDPPVDEPRLDPPTPPDVAGDGLLPVEGGSERGGELPRGPVGDVIGEPLPEETGEGDGG